MHSIFAGRPTSLATGVRAIHTWTLQWVMAWPLHLHGGHPLHAPLNLRGLWGWQQYFQPQKFDCAKVILYLTVFSAAPAKIHEAEHWHWILCLSRPGLLRVLFAPGHTTFQTKFINQRSSLSRQFTTWKIPVVGVSRPFMLVFYRVTPAKTARLQYLDNPSPLGIRMVHHQDHIKVQYH